MTAPTAGWYADPSGGSGLRYWNGTGWTESTQQQPQSSYAQPSSYDQPSSYPHPSSYPQPSSYGQPSAPYGQNGGYPGSFPAGPNPSSGHPSVPGNGGAAAGLWAQNRTSFITVGICIVYLVIAGFSHLVFFGILPVLYTVRAFQAKESLAWLAAVVTVVTVGFSLWRLVH